MKKFQNVESKVTASRPGTTAGRLGTTSHLTGMSKVSATGQENQAMNSARVRQQLVPGNIAFGKNYRTGSASNISQTQADRLPSARSALNNQNIHQFDNRESSGVAVKRPVDPEVVVFTGDEAKAAAVGAAYEPGPQHSATHRNYGKVPKYIEKYKTEAVDLAKKREELRAQKALPPGMTKMDEAERVQMLEHLVSTKRELQSTLESLPISMRSEALRKQKRELEERLNDVDRGITTFSRKVVFV